jgi:DNA-binding NarL/FixJ family response regulator
MSLKVCVIEDDRTVSDHLSLIFKNDSRIKESHFARNKAEATHKIQHFEFDLFLLDLGLPDVDGQDLISVIKQQQPDSKIIILTSLSSSRHILECFQKGANSYLLKHEVSNGIIDKMLQTVNGNAPVSPEVSKVLISKINASQQPIGLQPSEKLKEFNITEKEAEVLHYLTQGHSVDAIATRINRTSHTVNLHLRSLYKKLNVHSRGAAVHVAISEGLIAHL